MREYKKPQIDHLTPEQYAEITGLEFNIQSGRGYQ
jgi:hypothetical protein